MLENIRTYLRKAFRSAEGATAVEYGIMVALIAAVIIAAVVGIGTATKDGFTKTCTAMTTEASLAGDCA